MPHIDVYLFNKKGIKRDLTLVLDEGEEILSCIKKGMIDNNLSEVKVEAIEGRAKELLLNYFVRNNFKSSTEKDANIMLASGGFKLSYGELFGSAKVVTGGKPPVHGTLVKGIAADGLTIKLSFVELVDNPLAIKDEKKK